MSVKTYEVGAAKALPYDYATDRDAIEQTSEATVEALRERVKGAQPRSDIVVQHSRGVVQDPILGHVFVIYASAQFALEDLSPDSDAYRDIVAEIAKAN